MHRLLAAWRLGLLVVLASLVATGCRLPVYPSVSEVRVGAMQPPLGRVLRLECEATVSNPNDQPLTLKRSFVHVWLAGARIARIEVPEEVPIAPGRSTVRIPLEITMRSASDLLRLGLLGWERIAANAELEGKIYVRYRGVPLTAHVPRTPYTSLAGQSGIGPP